MHGQYFGTTQFSAGTYLPHVMTTVVTSTTTFFLSLNSLNLTNTIIVNARLLTRKK